MRVLIAGCGYVGTSLAKGLARDGDTVFALRRGPSDLGGDVTTLRADLLDSSALEAIPETVDAVVYTVSAEAPDEESYKVAYVEGVRALQRIFSVRREPSPRFLFASSTSVYGQSKGEWINEESVTLPESFRGRIILEGEKAALGFSDEVCAVRFGGIYGPGRTRLLKELQAGTLQLPRQRPYFTNRIHREDAAGVLRHLLRLESVPSKLLAVDSEPADLHEIAEWVSRRTDQPSPFVGMEGWKRGLGHKRCSNSLLRSLGYQLRFPSFREGYGLLAGEAGGSERI